MKKNIFSFFILFFVAALAVQAATRTEILLQKNWKFTKGDFADAVQPRFDDSKWETVAVPHDWAIYGPFDKANDLQVVAIEQNGEQVATEHTGRSGGLPYAGVGWYRTRFNVQNFSKNDKRVALIFDGAMSEARVYVNGREAAYWAYGYNAFHCDVTDLLNADGADNMLAVRLENRPQSSRWYPGAGLYRNVHLVVTDKTHVPVWGTHITTPYVWEQFAQVNLKINVKNVEGEFKIITQIVANNGEVVATSDNYTVQFADGNNIFAEDGIIEQNIIVQNPQLWSPETPHLYKAVSRIFANGQEVDSYTTPFGIRDIKLVADKGFFLNGHKRKFRGVCLHHDLGALGAAVNTAALRRQLTLLKDMGCDAIRTSHNMPAPELVQLCDEMGFMMMLEPFDEWDIAKCQNGYHRFFDEWAERDMVNMLHHFRNHPSVVMWSIGNEVPTQCSKEGADVARFLRDICRREDPTRPVTCGMDRVDCTLTNGFATVLDVPGLNYRDHRYMEAYTTLPQKLVLGSETASTISSRGVYKFPVQPNNKVQHADHQCSSYDMESCWWSNLPEEDFALADDHEWTIGQFVWTGFDYLGEPTPYDVNGWPNHSSMFGIIDLAGIPKDRYYLYRSIWNTTDNTLHVLPHWNWAGREGQATPVFAYTNYPSAELFINGKSYGRRTKNDSTLQHRYRLMWTNSVYEAGEIKVVAYDAAGKPAAEKVVRTAGAPHHIELVPNRTQLSPDGADLAYITVQVVDAQGNLCPNDSRLINFSVAGNGRYKASANGDPTCLDLFHLPQMHLFGGQLTAIVQSNEQQGKFTFEAKAKGVKGGKIEIEVSTGKQRPATN
ncbi:beta-galactosidase [Bacteroidia bacterium]|nr:beta-galactosidase [Bacteroidia bacterium]